MKQSEVTLSCGHKNTLSHLLSAHVGAVFNTVMPVAFKHDAWLQVQDMLIKEFDLVFESLNIMQPEIPSVEEIKKLNEFFKLEKDSKTTH